MGHRSHRRAKLTVEGRKTIVRRSLEEGWPACRIAEAMDVSRATVHKWLARYEAEGEAGLVDRSARPHRQPARLSAARERAILDRRRRTREGPHRLAWALGESPSTVHAVLARRGAPRLCDLDRASGTVIRYERDHPGELVHVDVKKQGRIPDGGGWWAHGREQAGRINSRRRSGHEPRLGYDYLHIAVDDRSRLAYVEALADERRDTAAAFLDRALAWFADRGVAVQRVMTDNGACYRSRAFRAVLVRAGVAHKRTRAYRPQTNGKAERFNLTLKHEWAYAAVYHSNQARLGDLDRWLHHYNHHRPHTAHQGGAPMSSVNNVPAKHS